MRGTGGKQNNSQTAEMVQQTDQKLIKTLTRSVTRQRAASTAEEHPTPDVKHQGQQCGPQIISVLEFFKWAKNGDLFCTRGHNNII